MTLTPRQRAIVDYIRDYVDVKGYAPTIQEIATWFGISKAGAGKHLEALQRKGAVRRDRYVARSLRIVDRVADEDGHTCGAAFKR